MSDPQEFVEEEVWESRANRYRCCCGFFHLKRASCLVGIVDIFLLSGTFARGIHLFLSVKTNPVAAAWFVASTLIFSLEILVIFAHWYGTWKEKSLWLLPKLVLKMFTILLSVLVIFGLCYLVAEGSRIVIGLIANEMNLGFYAARQMVRIGGILLIAAACLFVGIELWFLVILYDSYRYIKRREFSRKSRKFRELKHVPQRTHNFAGITIQKLDLNLQCTCPKATSEFNTLDNSIELLDASPSVVKVQPYRILSQNTEIWKTPGHTQQDITLLVRNVPKFGIVALVGDLILDEKLYMDSQQFSPYEGAWDITTQRQNANMIICMADCVIPGHGRMFPVTEKHRIRAKCPSSPQ